MSGFRRGDDPLIRAYDDGVEQGSRGASPGECPFCEQPLRDAWVTGCLHGRTGAVQPERTPIRDDGAWSAEGGPSLRSTPSNECSLCGQLGTVPEQINDGREIEMFGATRYAWCLLCHRKVQPPWSDDYKRRWDLLRRPRWASILNAGTSLQSHGNRVRSSSVREDVKEYEPGWRTATGAAKRARRAMVPSPPVPQAVPSTVAKPCSTGT